MQEITATELKQKMDDGEDIQLIDVRQPDEYEFAKIEGAKAHSARRNYAANGRTRRNKRDNYSM